MQDQSGCRQSFKLLLLEMGLEGGIEVKILILMCWLVVVLSQQPGPRMAVPVQTQMRSLSR